MALDRFLHALETMLADAHGQLQSVATAESLEGLRVRFVGAKNGVLKAIQKSMSEISPEDRPAAGKRFNEIRDALQRAIDEAAERLTGSSTASKFKANFVDPTLPGLRPRIGVLHPITQTIEHLKEIMGRLGFSVTEGPEIEDEWHNFVALNIPDDHPARDPLDNFYLATAKAAAGQSAPHRLMRSQTSTVQIRVMEAQPLPMRIISLGRVYRPDAPDATHFPMFHQMEGLWVDEHVTMAQLKSVLRLFATSYLGEDVKVRFRPSFFPFTEPSVEVDYWWNDQWIEFGGAGMVDPNVFRSVNIDPERWSGFAFGLGVERLCMRRFGITDIRDLYRSDVRFLRQFAS